MTEKFYKLNQLISQIVTAVPDMGSLLEKIFWFATWVGRETW